MHPVCNKLLHFTMNESGFICRFVLCFFFFARSYFNLTRISGGRKQREMISLAMCPPAKPPGGSSICSTQSRVGQMRLVLWLAVCWFICMFHCFCSWLFSRFCFSFVCCCFVLVLFFFSFSGLGGNCLQNSYRIVIIWTSFEILKGFFQVWTKQWKMV